MHRYLTIFVNCVITREWMSVKIEENWKLVATRTKKQLVSYLLIISQKRLRKQLSLSYVFSFVISCEFFFFMYVDETFIKLQIFTPLKCTPLFTFTQRTLEPEKPLKKPLRGSGGDFFNTPSWNRFWRKVASRFIRNTVYTYKVSPLKQHFKCDTVLWKSNANHNRWISRIALVRVALAKGQRATIQDNY